MCARRPFLMPKWEWILVVAVIAVVVRVVVEPMEELWVGSCSTLEYS